MSGNYNNTFQRIVMPRCPLCGTKEIELGYLVCIKCHTTLLEKAVASRIIRKEGDNARKL